MTCAACAARIEKRLNRIDGVAASVNYATKTATVDLDPDRAARPDLIALTERGLLVPGVPRFRPIADVAVVLDDDGGSYLDRFLLAAEVLSPSNSEEYIAIKRSRYIQHPENLYVLVVAQDMLEVTISARAKGWEPQSLRALDDTVDLPELGARFTLRALYRGTPLAAR